MHGFPMAVGSLLKESVVVYVRNWRPFTVMSLAAVASLGILLTLVPLSVMYWMLFTLPAVGWDPTWQENAIIIGSVAVILVVAMLPYNMAKAMMVMAVSQYYVEGRVAIWPCLRLALRRVISLTLSSIGVGFASVLIFFVLGFGVGYPFAVVFADPLNSLFGDDFWFDFGWTIPFWLSLPPAVLISWLFFVEGKMFSYDYSGNWVHSTEPEVPRDMRPAYLRLRVLSIGSVFTCGTVAVRSGVILGAVSIVVCTLALGYWREIPTLYFVFAGLFVPFGAALVVATPIAWIGRTLAYFDQMKRLNGRELDLVKDDSGAFCWAVRLRSE